MSILIYAESIEGKLKKGAFEIASYAKRIADLIGTTVTAVVINTDDIVPLANYGVSKVIKVNDEKLKPFSARAYAEVIKQVAKQQSTKIVLIASTTDSLYIAPFLSIKLESGYASNVIALPESISPFIVKRNVYSSKAFGFTEITTEIKLLSVAKNSFGLIQDNVNLTEENFTPTLNDVDFSVKVESVEKTSGKVTIADAEVVVSGGRGLKGPENWGIIEQLAEVLGAATACSKPVSDLGWRPHSEHVGQTGKPVSSNLYIAIGISGAIQHIAGINSSKVKVVINSDPEAPFFKVADYGVVGDAFEIVPKLIEKLKAFKAQNS